MSDESRPNVLLLVVDACRADFLSPYDGGVDRTPEIDSLSRDATVFERAVSPAPWTLPSVTSLLTGRYPHEHGATSRGFALDDGRTIVDDLAAAGYRCLHLSPKTWIGDWLPQGRGFHRVDEFTGPRHRRFEGGEDVRALSKGVARGPEWYATVLRRAFASDAPLQSLGNAAAFKLAEATGDAWLDDVRASERAARIADARFERLAEEDRPFFLYGHLMDPHLPFYVPPEFASDARPPGRDTAEGERAYMAGLMDDLWAIRTGDRHLSEAERRYLRTRYADEVAYADAVVGRILDALDRHGLDEETLVILTGDHGEHLGERVVDPAATDADAGDGASSGSTASYGAERTPLDHQCSIRLPLLRVPLIARLPGRFDADRRGEVVQTNYVAETVRSLAGLDHDPSRSLLAADADDRREVALAEYDGVVASHPPAGVDERVRARRRTAVANEWKLDRIAGRTRAARIDWAANRAETVPVGAVPDETRRALERALDRAEGARDADREGAAEMPEGVERNLRELGYL